MSCGILKLKTNANVCNDFESYTEVVVMTYH